MSEPKPLLAPLRADTTEPRLWRAGKFTDDTWRTVAADAPYPIDGRAIVPLAFWRAEQSALIATGLPVGIVVQPGETLDPQTDNLDRLDLIAFPFAKFSDGRAYSSARRLREQWGYRGEIRATGDVLLDQVPLMLRSGFDALEIVNSATIAALELGRVPAVSHTYQRSVGIDRFGWRSRLAVNDRLTAAE